VDRYLREARVQSTEGETVTGVLAPPASSRCSLQELSGRVDLDQHLVRLHVDLAEARAPANAANRAELARTRELSHTIALAGAW
jgi:hypothetical protein